ncbi:MAG: hypothetical protein IJW70_02725 [Clostridia bacterium]|nr:hypothetical protein [Clostridia bacterium]
MEDKKKRMRTWICILLAAALLLGACALTLTCVLALCGIGMTGGNGLLTSSEIVTETEHYRIDSGMMGYFFTRTLDGYYEEFEKHYEHIDDQADKEELIARAMGVQSFERSLKEQDYAQLTENGRVSVFDYYMDLTEQEVTRLLTFCEGACNQDITLDAKEYEEIDSAVKAIRQAYKDEKAAARKAGESYPWFFGTYLKQTYGAPLTVRGLRECLEIVALAEKYEKILSEQFENDEFTDAMVEQYAINHAGSFYQAEYYVYTKTVRNYNKSAAKYEEERAALTEHVARLAACQDKQAFRDTVLDIIVSDEKQSYRESQWDRYFKESGYVPELAEQMLEEYFAQRYTEEYLNTCFDGLHRLAYMSYTTDEQLRTWLFGTKEQSYADHAKTGEIKVLQDLEEYTNPVTGEVTSSFTVSVYFVDREAHRTTEITKHAGYVLFDDRQEAERFYEQYSGGEMNKDTLLATATQMQEEGRINPFACHAAEDYLPGHLANGTVRKNGELVGSSNGGLIVESVLIKGADEWLQSAGPGDCSGVLELVKVTKRYNHSSSVAGDNMTITESPAYGVLVYDGEGREYWYLQAVKGLLDMTSADWYEQNRLALTYHRQAYEQIDK